MKVVDITGAGLMDYYYLSPTVVILTNQHSSFSEFVSTRASNFSNYSGNFQGVLHLYKPFGNTWSKNMLQYDDDRTQMPTPYST
ncbi:predicted protein [Sclerotinia sclerotiorum 1980 UF-70]|uniref:Uncharacterized protein n=1 Tax=Sclerotinia sclerotiorum (strain ATCC 18683 / 1980 / Ss-1) TaxID=665079 RepID=A7F988_SCLS1|nr:predicted protein [Sclerotinia sclerotiorum 1980 UF-70]EDO00299.1 predicted protein [Sclerotinia sclerotiorum 1980 UF-70]